MLNFGRKHFIENKKSTATCDKQGTMLLAVPPYFRVLITLHSFMCIRSATRTSNLAHLPGKCFSSEDSHTEISKRFAWNALSRWHIISASLHLLYLHMFIVQNHDNYYIILRLCQCVSSAHLTLQLPDKKSEVLITDTSDFALQI